MVKETLPEERETTATGLFGGDYEDVPRLTPDELAAALAGPNLPTVLDVRTGRRRVGATRRSPAAYGCPPDEISVWAERQTPGSPIVAYCTWPDEATSSRAASCLRSVGSDASALAGGLSAWRERFPVAPAEAAA